MTTYPRTVPATPSVQDAIEAACSRIAPSWPLDRMIAVNPFWGFVDRPIEAASAELAAHSGATLLMSHDWYRAQWRAGRMMERHLGLAIARNGATRRVADLVAVLVAAETHPVPPRHLLMTDVLDATRDLGHAPAWRDHVVRQISQCCAACFDDHQASWLPERNEGLYPLWRALTKHDSAPSRLMGFADLRAATAALPTDPRELIALALAELDVPPDHWERYCTALLLSIGGWASACAFRRWDARLRGSDDDQVLHLLAVRMAWDLLLARGSASDTVRAAWQAAKAEWESHPPTSAALQEERWLIHHALEIAYQEELARLVTEEPAPVRTTAPSAQVVCCIDVRSEVLRRAIEQAAPTIDTLGFAGFFGLPIAYQPLNGPPRAQLPGLLAPTLIVSDAGSSRETRVARDRAALALSSTITTLGRSPASAFSFVEAAGLGWIGSLLRDGLALGRAPDDPLRTTAARDAALRPELACSAAAHEALPASTRVDLAEGILRSMSLTDGFAPLLVLLGHGTSSDNNPQAAGLHCGACGGQTGEVNARAAAALLNDPAVRDGLRERGIDLGATAVVPGLHDTTTDEVTLFDLEHLPTARRSATAELQASLRAAGALARRERAADLGLAGASDEVIDRTLRRRGRDWSEVRPEWGLAGNAAFVIAPRRRTRGVDLHGRAFLHEYDWHRDGEGRVLEAIMTAPMIVTHWINMQYHASTVDPLRYGSGNKVLHNVVGGRLGVMEGAGGDLRIGLARQSVHDGTTWRHEPLRLSVLIEAPQHAIDGILQKHALLRHLVGHRWLFLHQVDPGGMTVTQWTANGWTPVEPARPDDVRSVRRPHLPITRLRLLGRAAQRRQDRGQTIR